ncbi:MAG TPA: hypothetical protein VEU62_22590, partial [Bryobacterales bacterium]|nr:hypothetical protein [Bryobacterales bacterium]
MSDSLGGRWPRVYLGVAATSAATLLLELSLTRIFSVVLFYHFAFMAISLALFGLGAGAVCSYYCGASRRPPALWSLLGYLSTVNMGVTVGALLIVLHQPVSIAVNSSNAERLAVIYFASSAPFFLAGIVMSLAIAETIERVDRVYFWDLLGAGAGCLLLVPLLDLAGGPNTVLAAGVLYAAAAALWYGVADDRGRTRLSVALALLLALFCGVNLRTKWIDVRYAKGKALEPELFSRWNSFSRVAVERHPDGDVNIVIDADAATGIPQFAPDDPAPAVRHELERNGPSVPYRMHPGARALIIGPGGGYDVARAIANGSKDVTGVEINPIIVNDIMKGRFAALSHNLYFRPEVRIEIEDGRSYVRRSREEYQVIQMTLVDTWASTAAGAFALSENNLYTTDAFVDYLQHLTGDGMLAITRWEFEPPRESLRVVSLGIEALRRINAPEPWRHFVIGRDNAQEVTGYGAKDTVVVKRTALTPEEIARARQAMKESGMAAIFLPDERIPNTFTEL